MSLYLENSCSEAWDKMSILGMIVVVVAKPSSRKFGSHNKDMEASEAFSNYYSS